jgi:pyruvate/2-oxoglutarate dehydrogenase complex dihydrolipoamide dehydrogenase (E3) component
MLDLVVVGGGTAGIVAAKTAGRMGASVAVVERARTGGDCLWTGCVPSKALIAAAASVQAVRDASRFGVRSSAPVVDFDAVLDHVRRAIATIEPVDSPAALAAAGARVLHGEAVFTGPREIRVGSEVLSFRRAVIATGSMPSQVVIPGAADPLTTETVWDLVDLPESLVVVGAGPVGCELGQAFARLGSEVTLVERAERILPSAEPRASAVLAEALEAEGVRVLTGSSVVRVVGGVALVDTGSSSIEVAAGQVLAAAGRTPRTTGIGLSAAGVDIDERGYVRVDAKLRTSNSRIFAAGDVTGAPAFTHVAGMHGSIAATNALLAAVRSLDVDRVPSVVFTAPEVAQVGLTESRARQRHGRGVRTRVLDHTEVDRAVAEDRTSGFTQVVLDGRGRVLGATVVGPRAGEMLTELTPLVARGGRLRELAGVVHPYPGWADGVWKVALAEVADALARPVPRAVSGGLRTLRQLAGGR